MYASPRSRAIAETPELAGLLDSTESNGTEGALRAPPQTPLTQAPIKFTPPPLLPGYSADMPALRKALYRNSLDQVRKALEDDPDLATEPFWEHDWEPALCCAVRLRCDARIVQMLLECGASPDDTDKHGRTPMQIHQLHQEARKHACAIAPWGWEFVQCPLLDVSSPVQSPNSYEKFIAALRPLQDKIPGTAWYATDIKPFDVSLSVPCKGNTDRFQEVTQLLTCP